MATPEILTIASLSCRYPQLSVLENVSFSVHEGEMVCLLGASGDGKTTLLKSIAGLLPQEQGRIAIAGQRTDAQAQGAEPPHAWWGWCFRMTCCFPI